MIKVKLSDLIFDEISQMGIILLEEETTQKVLPIWVGLFEAQAILFKLQNMYFPRPLTHDLLKNVVETLGGIVELVLISLVKDNTFYAEIHIRVGEKKFVLDSRPSDAIALAVRTSSPIYVSEEIMSTVFISKEDFTKEQKEKFYKQLLEFADTEEDKRLKH
ncbi:MAG: bifunctional nuclease family protein [Endomicrobiia bacterium]